MASLSVCVILLISSMSAIQVRAVGGKTASSDWLGVDGNYPFNFNFSPQNMINASTAQRLEVKWILPIPTAPRNYGSPLGGAEGVTITSMVIKGIVYSITSYHRLYALDGRDGKILWQKDLPLLNFKGIDVGLPWGNFTGHYHAIWYTETLRSKPLVWLITNNYTVFAFNALNGDPELQFPAINVKERYSGNFGIYATFTPTLNIDQRRGILVVGTAVSEGTSAGRGFLEGFDVTQSTPRLLWRTFVVPPQDGSDPNWSIKSVQNMSYAYTFDGKQQIDLKKLSQQQLHSSLFGDWGTFGFNGTHSHAGAGPAWGGSWALDPSTGIMFIGTAQAAPDYNATNRPGPNLWSDSILAVDEKTGKIIWGFQAIAHDLWDVDCSWNVVLANATINNQVKKTVFKACKHGTLLALDAATGGLQWYFDPPSIKRAQYDKLLNPLDGTQMTKPWMGYPLTTPVISDRDGNGNLESDIAYDPNLNLVFMAPFNDPSKFQPTPVGSKQSYGTTGDAYNFGLTLSAWNTTVWAIDVNTGKPAWSFFIDKFGFRGGLAVSGGVVYVPMDDGFLRMIDEGTGKLIEAKFIGGPMSTQPAVATDSNGDVKLFMTSAAGLVNFAAPGYAVLSQSIPGFMFALGLSPLTQVTVTTTVATAGGGFSSESFYAAVAVAVIFLITTGVLAVRRRKP